MKQSFSLVSVISLATSLLALSTDIPKIYSTGMKKTFADLNFCVAFIKTTCYVTLSKQARKLYLGNLRNIVSH